LSLSLLWLFVSPYNMWTLFCSFLINIVISSRNMVKKVKCTLVQALRLCTGRTAQRGSRGIALLFHDHGTRRGWGVTVTPRPLFIPRKDPVTIIQEAGWATEPVWTGAGNLAHTGIRFLDRSARSQSLYRLHHRAHTSGMYIRKTRSWTVYE
jgi:hypothetical protein